LSKKIENDYLVRTNLKSGFMQSVNFVLAHMQTELSASCAILAKQVFDGYKQRSGNPSKNEIRLQRLLE
jgi:hypothetical protein